MLEKANLCPLPCQYKAYSALSTHITSKASSAGCEAPKCSLLNSGFFIKLLPKHKQAPKALKTSISLFSYFLWTLGGLGKGWKGKGNLQRRKKKKAISEDFKRQLITTQHIKQLGRALAAGAQAEIMHGTHRSLRTEDGESWGRAQQGLCVLAARLLCSAPGAAAASTAAPPKRERSPLGRWGSSLQISYFPPSCWKGGKFNPPWGEKERQGTTGGTALNSPIFKKEKSLLYEKSF